MITVGDRLLGFKLSASISSGDPKNMEFPIIGDNDLMGRWSVIVAWPKDFTFVCPTEILGYGQLLPKFKARDTALIGLSTDSEYVHLAWRNSRQDLGELDFPWLADRTQEFSGDLGILSEDGNCMRVTIIVDPQLIVRHVTVNDDKVGRNPEETLRILDALQTDKLTPCGWKKGDPSL